MGAVGVSEAAKVGESIPLHELGESSGSKSVGISRSQAEHAEDEEATSFQGMSRTPSQSSEQHPAPATEPEAASEGEGSHSAQTSPAPSFKTASEFGEADGPSTFAKGKWREDQEPESSNAMTGKSGASPSSPPLGDDAGAPHGSPPPADTATGTDPSFRRMTTEDETRATQRLNDFTAVRDGVSPSTGHTKASSEALKTRVDNDPMVKLHKNDLDHAMTGMRAARTAGDYNAVETWASKALTSAKDLDAARKTVESTGVFQAGNTFGRKAALATGATAAASLVAGGTTGGIIAWNNHIQGENPPKST